MSLSRSETEKRIIEKTIKDPGFREKLKSDPKGTLEEELGGSLPDGINIHLNEEDANNIHITLPHSQGELSGELSGEELSGISGGWSISGSGCASGQETTEAGERAEA